MAAASPLYAKGRAPSDCSKRISLCADQRRIYQRIRGGYTVFIPGGCFKLPDRVPVRTCIATELVDSFNTSFNVESMNLSTYVLV